MSSIYKVRSKSDDAEGEGGKKDGDEVLSSLLYVLHFVLIIMQILRGEGESKILNMFFPDGYIQDIQFLDRTSQSLGSIALFPSSSPSIYLFTKASLLTIFLVLEMFLMQMLKTW